MRPIHFALPALAALLATTPALAAGRDFNVRGFSQVDLKSIGDVTITPGAGFAVHAEGDQELVDRLQMDVRDGVLVIGWQRGESTHTRNSRIDISITMPRVNAVAVGGAGSIHALKGSGPQFGASVSGAGRVKVDQLEADRTVIAMSGAGSIILAGRTREIQADVSGVGQVDATALAASSGRVGVSGTGQAKAQINGPVTVVLSGVGQVDVTGRPVCTVRKSGLGSVKCG